MHAFSQGDYDLAIERLRALLEVVPEHLDARLALGMAHCRKGDLPAAIEEGHRAEKLHPHEPLVHTNLSLFYVQQGDKAKAEHHGLQARIAGWRKEGAETPPPAGGTDSLRMAGSSAPKPMKFSGRLPKMPWKKKGNDTGDE